MFKIHWQDSPNLATEQIAQNLNALDCTQAAFKAQVFSEAPNVQGVFRPLHVGVQEHYSKVRNAAKRMQPICKICAPHFDKKCAALLWFASGFVRQARNIVLQHFMPKRGEIRRNAPHFHGESTAILGTS